MEAGAALLTTMTTKEIIPLGSTCIWNGCKAKKLAGDIFYCAEHRAAWHKVEIEWSNNCVKYGFLKCPKCETWHTSPTLHCRECNHHVRVPK